MTSNESDRINKQQLKEVTALARTLDETAEDLYQLTRTRHPEQHQAGWLIKQAHVRIHHVLAFLGEDF